MGSALAKRAKNCFNPLKRFYDLSYSNYSPTKFQSARAPRGVNILETSIRHLVWIIFFVFNILATKFSWPIFSHSGSAFKANFSLNFFISTHDAQINNKYFFLHIHFFILNKKETNQTRLFKKNWIQITGCITPAIQSQIIKRIYHFIKI